MQKEGRVHCFAAGLLCAMAKGKEYSEYTPDADFILAHYRVVKHLQAVASLGNTIKELTSTNPTMTV